MITSLLKWSHFTALIDQTDDRKIGRRAGGGKGDTSLWGEGGGGIKAFQMKHKWIVRVPSNNNNNNNNNHLFAFTHISKTIR